MSGDGCWSGCVRVQVRSPALAWAAPADLVPEMAPPACLPVPTARTVPATVVKRTISTIFAKFAMKGGLVREIRLSSKTRFSNLMASVCECQGLNADKVCFFFEGKQLEPDQVTSDVEMYNGAVVSVIAWKLVYDSLDSSWQSSGPSRIQESREQLVIYTLEEAGCVTVAQAVQITGASSSQALVDAMEASGWIHATPKLRQLIRDFYGDPRSPADTEESEDDVPLARINTVREENAGGSVCKIEPEIPATSA